MKEYKVAEARNAYDPSTRVEGDYSKDFKESSELFKAFSYGCSINNRAEIVMKGNEIAKIGEPTEAALKVLAEKLN